ncbi:GNAT family N-acetyltransferase [Aliishimia ponticola]|uniref:GNAT family N-acetyltransferase n=1 Tax=Aliishimia ponticola TaxID=2499833 RepID=A0A4S4N674_9RHOB|nr:GNAT family N-acetyltransferase [Aliishimia ponticola]THH34624.1 GNAT family N-acetyltransferase [Aliishimia ponticola]
MIDTRPATPLDARPMAALLNAIIEKGGTTALVRPVTAEDLHDWMEEETPGRSAWHVAVAEDGEIVGFQWIEPAQYLPEDAAEIATFVQIGRTGLGIGSALFEATKKAARHIGYAWINANIRADNDGGLVYYQSRGFRDYDRWEGYKLENGEVVDKVLKRYDLD